MEQQSDNQAGPKKKVWLYVFLLLVATILLTSIIVVGSVFLGLRWLANQSPTYQQYPTPEPPSAIDFPLPSNAPVIGSENSPILILEFADFQCPFCKEFHDNVFPRLKADYVDTGKVRFAFLDFAFLGDESVQAASAARCAGDQGKFWEYHDRLFDNQTGENEGTFTPDKLKKLAVGVVPETTNFNSCVDAHLAEAEVADATRSAGQAGITSTPTLLINGRVISGVRTFDEYAELINQELDKQ